MPVMNMTDAMIYAMETPGALAVAFVEMKTGRAVAGLGNEVVDFDRATPGWTEILHMQTANLDRENAPNPINDLVITTDTRFHVLRPLTGRDASDLYLYLVLDKSVGSIPLAQYRLGIMEKTMVL